MLVLLLVALASASIENKSEDETTTVSSNQGNCEPLPTFSQDTPSTKAGFLEYSPPMAEGLEETFFSCDPLPGHNLTMVTSFSAFFGDDPFLYVSPANSRWQIKLQCNKEQRYWYHEELVEDILYHVKFYKIRCNSFLFTDAQQMDVIAEELKDAPFP